MLNLFYVFHVGRCAETCSSLQSSIIKSYLSVYDTYKINNNNDYNNISNNNSNNMTSSVSLQIMKQLICAIDGQRKESYDTSLDNNHHQNKNDNTNENEEDIYFSIDFGSLGDYHPFKLFANEIFEVLISALQPINITIAREIITAKEKVAKMVYPDALSLDRTQNIPSTYK